jgi:nitrogen PTS system EIIA component
MRVLDILTSDRVSVANATEGPVDSKAQALARLAALLARGVDQGPGGSAAPGTARPTAQVIAELLHERERLQSTGVGGGVAIPHGGLDSVDTIVGALLLCPEPISFDAIDGEPVSILFAVIGPKRATGEHLKTLARVSRLLRDESFRGRLLASRSGAEAFQLIASEEGRSLGA